MKIFPPEPQVKIYEEGFEEQDILQRASVGKALSDLVERIEDPMVVALDGHWGTGKTYFLKRWVGAHHLENQGEATTVYFDAFANDYWSDPLAALVSTLSERFPPPDMELVEKIKSAAFKFAKPLARIGLAMASYGATETLNSLGDAAVNAASGEASNALESYWRQEDGRRAAMEEFRLALNELVANPQADADSSVSESSSQAGTRLVIVVDELDRCRPDYALEILEVIKHFFSVPGVSFILGANLAALENSVKARYGGDMDASAYLRKFINATLTLPSAIGHRHNLKEAVSVYLEHHMSEMGTPQHIAERLKPHIQLVARNNKVSIRDVGKILTAISLLSNDILKRPGIFSGYIEVTIALIVSEIVRPEIYPKFLNATVSERDLEDYFDAGFIRRTRQIDDEMNSKFDHYTWQQFNLWMYLSQDGQLPNEDAETNKRFGRLFSDWSGPDDPRSIPRSAHRDWLDLFTSTTT